VDLEDNIRLTGLGCGLAIALRCWLSVGQLPWQQQQQQQSAGATGARSLVQYINVRLPVHVT